MSKKEDEAGIPSRESVRSQLTMSDIVSAEGEVDEAQRRKTACARARREQAMEGAQEKDQCRCRGTAYGGRQSGLPLEGAECDQRGPR